MILCAKILSSTGINYSVQLACTGVYGASHTNLWNQTTSTVVGGPCSLHQSEPKKRSCLHRYTAFCLKKPSFQSAAESIALSKVALQTLDTTPSTLYSDYTTLAFRQRVSPSTLAPIFGDFKISSPANVLRDATTRYTKRSTYAFVSSPSNGERSFVALFDETAALVKQKMPFRFISPCRNSPQLSFNTPLRSDAMTRHHLRPTQGTVILHRLPSYVASKPPLCPLMPFQEHPIRWANKRWNFSAAPCHTIRPHLLPVSGVTNQDIR